MVGRTEPALGLRITHQLACRHADELVCVEPRRANCSVRLELRLPIALDLHTR